jgi:hypothetical protein
MRQMAQKMAAAQKEELGELKQLQRIRRAQMFLQEWCGQEYTPRLRPGGRLPGQPRAAP